MDSNERVQLKQEETVGDDVVMSDIYPKTTTTSVDDVANGMNLEQTIDRMWNAINNKLSRIVNSVNSRTGVVVLTADDVGLGNVDNVSLGDIKQWVIDKLEYEFGNHRIILYDYLDDVYEAKATNDSRYKDTTFYSSHGTRGIGDMKSYIGYYYWDDTTDTLEVVMKDINVVGYTDNSLIYDEIVNDKDLSKGGLGVNIYKFEDALELYNASASKSESGLRIKKENIVGKLYFFDGIYGDSYYVNDEPVYKNNLLYFTNDPLIPSDAPEVIIRIDGKQSEKSYLYTPDDVTNNLKVGDLIICRFNDTNYRDDNGILGEGVNNAFISRQPCIGRVNNGPTSESPNTTYVIEFWSIKPFAGWGLQYIPTTTSNAVEHDNILGIQLARGYSDGFNTGGNNVSGLQVLRDTGCVNPNNVESSTNRPSMREFNRITMLPQGPVEVFKDHENSHGGLYIQPDSSLCVIPGGRYINGGTESGGSHVVSNWPSNNPAATYYSDPDTRQNSYTDGLLDDNCALGVNLLKIVGDQKTEDNKFRFLNISGLRISSYNSTNKEVSPNEDNIVSPEWLGMTEDDDTGDIAFGKDKSSGGLSVNVGKYLEIDPGSYADKAINYYDGGKVNVRINESKGLKGENNRIVINVGSVETNDCKGLTFNETTGALNINIDSSKGLTFNDDSSLALKLSNAGGLAFDNNGLKISAYDPLYIAAENEICLHYNTSQGLDVDDSGALYTKIDTDRGLSFKSGALGVNTFVSGNSTIHFNDSGTDIELPLYTGGLGFQKGDGSTQDVDYKRLVLNIPKARRLKFLEDDASISFIDPSEDNSKFNTDSLKKWQGMVVVNKKNKLVFTDMYTGTDDDGNTKYVDSKRSATYDPLADTVTVDEETYTIQLGSGLQLYSAYTLNSDGTHGIGMHIRINTGSSDSYLKLDEGILKLDLKNLITELKKTFQEK